MPKLKSHMIRVYEIIRIYYLNTKLCVYIIIHFIHSIQSDEHLPDMMWCREPFLEIMKDIDDLNYTDD